jgi:drug/metabolite transporter (DMT)-like permease
MHLPGGCHSPLDGGIRCDKGNPKHRIHSIHSLPVRASGLPIVPARSSTLAGFFATTGLIMGRGETKLPGAVVGGLVLAIVLDTIIQIAWKLAVSGVPGTATVTATVREALSNPFFWVAMLAFGAQLFNWVRVLARADLSFAQPFTALSYISVLAISAHSLHETIAAPKMLGVALILLGVFFISRTPFRTAGAHGPDPMGPDSPRS